jgi:benzoyl-CoA reductase subunit C
MTPIPYPPSSFETAAARPPQDELAELRHDLGTLRGKPITDDELRNSIALYKESRRLLCEVSRAERPWQAPAAEVNLIMRAGLVLSIEQHTDMLRNYLTAARAEERPRRDNCRIVLTGVFCDQPPLDLIKSLELAGCYVVDDLLSGHALAHRQCADQGRLDALSRSPSCIFRIDRGEIRARPQGEGQHLVRAAKRSNAEGVNPRVSELLDPRPAFPTSHSNSGQFRPDAADMERT